MNFNTIKKTFCITALVAIGVHFNAWGVNLREHQNDLIFQLYSPTTKPVMPDKRANKYWADQFNEAIGMPYIQQADQGNYMTATGGLINEITASMRAAASPYQKLTEIENRILKQYDQLHNINAQIDSNDFRSPNYQAFGAWIAAWWIDSIRAISWVRGRLLDQCVADQQKQKDAAQNAGACLIQ